MYDLDLPTIDWEKVREGIRKQIKYLVKSDEKDSHSHRMIGDDSKGILQRKNGQHTRL